MHDTDRTMGRTHLEAEAMASQRKGANYMNGTIAYEAEDEFQGEQGEAEGVLGEAELNEFAAELLGVRNDQELEQFLGKIFKTIGRTAGKVIRSPVGRQLGGMLKQAAGAVLPVAGAALGNLVAPGVGGMVGGQLASAAGSMLGLELEGLSQEDQEFEVAKQYVRLASEAAQNAAQAPAQANPQAVAQNAISQAARKFAPGLRPGQGAAGRSGQASGRWVRKGNQIVLYGI